MTSWITTYWSPRRPPRTSGMPFPRNRKDCPCWVPAGPAARRAAGGRHDLAEERLRGAPDLAGAAASGTSLLPGPRLGPTPGAVLAGGEARHVDLPLHPAERLLECDRQVVAEVITAVRPLASRAGAKPAAEERVEDVGERHVREIDGRSAGTDRRMSEKVVAAPAVGIGQHGVGLACLLEAFVRDGVVRVAVGVRVHRDLAKRPLQILGRRLPSDAQDLVVVALDGH